jgi:hypothetical protein
LFGFSVSEPVVTSLYDIARQVTDEVFGTGTYADVNKNHPNPGVQAAIAKVRFPKPRPTRPSCVHQIVVVDRLCQKYPQGGVRNTEFYRCRKCGWYGRSDQNEMGGVYRYPLRPDDKVWTTCLIEEDEWS